MRRPARLGLVAAILLIAGFAAYSVLWWIAAGRIADGVAAWAQGVGSQGIAASWQAIRVGGYPFAFRVEFTDAQIADTALTPAPNLAAPHLSAVIRPWDWHDAIVAAANGLAAESAGTATLAAASATGTVTLGKDGGTAIWLALRDVKAAFATLPDARASAETAQLWLALPPAPPATHTDRNIALAADVTRLAIPFAPSALGKTIDDLAFGVTVMGAIPPGTVRQAAAGWRDGGGTIELDHFHLGWGALGIDAAGTLALDRDLQPVGSFSGAIVGYDELLAALVATGQIRQGDARPLRLVLGMLARPGPGGKKQIATAFSLQNGQIFVGPATLGRVPRIPW